MTNKIQGNGVTSGSFRKARWLSRDVKHNKINVSGVSKRNSILIKKKKKSKVCKDYRDFISFLNEKLKINKVPVMQTWLVRSQKPF